MKHWAKIVVFSVILALGLTASVALAAYEFEIPLPSVGGPKPEEGPAQYVRYIFVFSLGLGGVLAFASIVIGGIKLILAGGNVTTVEDARKQITQAILGLMLLLFSYLILKTINPQLVSLRNPQIQLVSPPDAPPDKRPGPPPSGEIGPRWCSYFVSWVYDRVQLGFSGGSSSYLNGGTAHPSVEGLWAWFQRNGITFRRGEQAPKVGDVIFFNPHGSHNGIVRFVQGNIVHTAEGNSGNRVNLNTYPITSDRIYGYGRRNECKTLDCSHIGSFAASQNGVREVPDGSNCGRQPKSKCGGGPAENPNSSEQRSIEDYSRCPSACNVLY